MVRLVFYVGNREPVELDLKPGEYSLGAGEGNTIVIDLPEIRDEHISIRVTDSLQVFLHTLGESDGLKVNGQTVTKSFIRPGDVVVAGSIAIAVEPVVNGVPDSDTEEARADGAGFYKSIPGAFRYPFTNDSAFVVAGIVIVLGLANLFGGIVVWVGMVLGFAVEIGRVHV